MGDCRNVFKILTCDPTERRHLERPKNSREGNITTNFREIGVNVRNWIDGQMWLSRRLDILNKGDVTRNFKLEDIIIIKLDYARMCI